MKEVQFYTQSDVQYYRGGYAAVNFYNDHCLKRREKYDFKIDEKYQKYVDQINDMGYSKIDNFFDLNKLEQFKKHVAEKFKNKENTKFTQNNCHEQIIEPYLNAQYTLDIATDERIIKIASAFFNCMPGLGTCNLRKSFPTNNPPAGTNMFHRDFNSPVKLLKFFVYLNDVDINNGPFTYVEGSNRQVPANPHWTQYHRWPDDQIEKVYGKNRIKYLTANYGDLLIATTNGFHKGLQIKQGERTMFTINYLIHPEIEGGNLSKAKKFYVNQTTVDALPDWKKPVTDFLIKV